MKDKTQTSYPASSEQKSVIHQPAAHSNRRALYIRTFGCQMNEYDSLKLAKILEPTHYSVSSSEEADLVIINTCSIRDKPEQKVYSLLGEIRELKAKRPELMVGVGGCVAQQEGARLLKRSRSIDFIFGTHNLSLVPSLIALREGGAPPQVAVDYRDDWEALPLGFTESSVSTFVAISRGCNKRCTYCIVPTTRGKEVSRDRTEIVKEVQIAVSRGAKEVVLLGQTVNSYGRDLNPRMSFVELLRDISEIPGVQRIRFTSPHPQEVREDFLSFIAENQKICRHIHLPLQSGSNTILRAMRRNYRRERYLAIASSLKERVPDISITTDIIVGFPGETRAHFEETLSLMELVRFDSSFSFMFSPRPGTVAARLEDSVSKDEKLSRLYELQRLQAKLTEESLAAWEGKEVEILIDGPTAADPAAFQGRTSQNIVVNLDPTEMPLAAGMLVTARVTGRNRNTLRGELARKITESTVSDGLTTIRRRVSN